MTISLTLTAIEADNLVGLLGGAAKSVSDIESQEVLVDLRRKIAGQATEQIKAAGQ